MQHGLNMAFVGASEAARLIGRNRAQIYRALKSGAMSATKNEQGATVIDTSELFRVFGEPVSKNTANVSDNVAPNNSQQAANGHEQAGLSALLAAEREKSALLAEAVADLRRERDRLLGLVESQSEQVRLLTDQREKAQAVAVALPSVRRWRWPWS